MSDATITIGADASAVERAANVAKAAWQNAGSAITSAVGQAAKQMVSDLASVATAQGKVNFSAQHQSVREFEGATARLAVSMERDLGGVRSSIINTGAEIGKRPQEVAAWASEVGRLTYNFKGAIDSQKGLAGLAAETGRSLSDYRGLATELANVGKVGGDTTDVIGVLTAQSEKLSVSGGIAAFADQIEGLGGTISMFATKSTADFEKVTALAGALGKGMNPQGAQRAQQSVLGTLQADPMRWERYLGRNIMDEHGQIPAADLPQIMQDIVAKTKGRHGARAKRILQMNFGNEGGAQLHDMDFAAASEAAGLAPSNKPAGALASYQATDAGKRDVASAQLEVSSINLMGSSTLLGRAADGLQRFAASNPLSTTAATVFATTAAATFSAGLGGAIAKMMGQKGAGGAVGGAIDLATKGAGAGRLALGLGAAGVALGAGYAAGTYLDDATGGALSGGLASAMDGGANARNEQIGFNADKKRRAAIAASQRQRVAQLEAGGMTHGMALYTADHEPAGGGGARGMSPEQLLAAFEKAIKGAKFEVKTRADTPVEVTAAGPGKASTGGQGK